MNWPKKLFAETIPLAAKPENSTRAVVRACDLCKKDIGLTRWESWTGFLVKCPHCGGINGMPWKPKSVILLSFLIQPLSFFATMRFSRAVIALVVYVLVLFGGNFLLTREVLPQLVELFGAVLFLFAPMFVNAFILIRHNSRLKKQNDKMENIADLLEGLRDLFS